MKISIPILPIILLHIICFSCHGNGNNFLQEKRNFTSEPLLAEPIKSSDNFKNYFANEPYLASLSDAKIGDLVFQYNSGENNRFFLKENKFVFYSWQGQDIHPIEHEVDKSYPFGLLIGQSAEKLYFYNSANKGKDFATYSLQSKKTNIISLSELVVTNVAELGNMQEILACGVASDTLGFFILDAGGHIKKRLKSIDLPFSPNGDPGVYGGKFYSFGEQIFFLFNNKSSIFHFDNQGNFIQEIPTIDSFSFKHKSNKGYNPQFDGLYKDLMVKNDQLIIRTNFVSSKNKEIVFDTYAILDGKYRNSFHVKLPDLDFSKFSFPIWSYFSTNGEYNLLFGTKYTSGAFSSFKVQL